jgi:hypothetical protein
LAERSIGLNVELPIIACGKALEIVVCRVSEATFAGCSLESTIVDILFADRGRDLRRLFNFPIVQPIKYL